PAVLVVTVAPPAKLVPVIVSVNAGALAPALLLLMLVTVGAALTVNSPLVANPPSGLIMMKLVVPGAIGVSDAVIVVAVTVGMPKSAFPAGLVTRTAPAWKFVPTIERGVACAFAPLLVMLSAVMLGRRLKIAVQLLSSSTVSAPS